MEDMCEITDKIEDIVNKDKNGKALILITKLIDDRFNSISKGQKSIETKIEHVNEKLVRFSENEKELKRINEDIESLPTIKFFCVHPKLGIMFVVFLILGILMAYFSGIDNLVQLIVK